MKHIAVLNIENYGIEDKEFMVGEGENLHRVIVHTFEEQDEEENPKERWHIVVSVCNPKKWYKVGTGVGTQYSALESTYHGAFLPAYRTACQNAGVVPCCTE